MRRDDQFLVDFEELAAVLRANEGPASPGTGSGGVERAKRHRRPRVRLAVGVGAAALVVGSGLGVGLASTVTPRGDAAEAPTGLGFLPERGWQVVRSRFEASPAQPSFAVASNVPLTGLDARLSRRRDWSGQPLEALRTLKAGGVVIVASFSLRGVHAPSDASFTRRTLPLRLRDAATAIQPNPFYARTEPLGWYEIRGAVDEYNVVVNVYFGIVKPSRASILAAQRQLDRLVVGTTESATQVEDRALPLRPAAPTVAAHASRIVDRTFACRPKAFGGVGDLDLFITPALGARSIAYTYLIVRTGAFNPADHLVLVRPLPVTGAAWLHTVGRGAAGVFANSRRCSPSDSSLALTPRGLSGPPSVGYRELDCPVRGRALVRVRSVLRRPVEWRRVDRSFEGVRQPVVRSQVAVRSERTGAPIAYMEHDAKGKTKLWFSSQCS